MRKIILLLVTILAFNLSNAQKKYGTFQSVRGAIKCSVDSKKGHIYLDLNTKGSQSIQFKDLKQRQVFIDFINSSLSKFKEWKQKAIDNDVNDLIKEIEVASVGDSYAFNYGGWNFAWGKTLVKAKMSISKSGIVNYALVIPKRTSSKNEYIKSKTSVIIFDNDEDVLNLSELLTDKVINAFLEKESNKKDIFD